MNGTSILISFSKHISIKMKNPESLGYYMFATNIFFHFYKRRATLIHHITVTKFIIHPSVR